MFRGLAMRRRAREAIVEPLQEFLRAESAGGMVLLAAAVLALVWANSPASGAYSALWDAELTLGTGPLAPSHDLRGWVNDGLMTLFFFVIGLEIKRELVTGELRRPRVAALPALAAVGGVVLPAVIFFGIVGTGEGAAGWGIPVATDIAFAVGVLAVLGSRIPTGVKLFLVSVAIVDDIIAIVIIALFYSESISLGWLGAAAIGLAAVLTLRRFGVDAVWPYALVGTVIWYATDSSGVHATIAGVALGLLTPAGQVRGREVLHELEHRLHPVTAFAVVPLFALANAGVDLRGGVIAEATGSRLAWGVAVGLVVGKTLGIGLVTLLAHRTRIASLPPGVGAGQVWGVAALAGIGFTVSLFVTELAYTNPALVDRAKVGIFAGSAIGAALGVTLLLRAARRSLEAVR
ncbi:MAG: Na+/H+ antiporter NhaA [Pseudonocardiaceae bacterium]